MLGMRGAAGTNLGVQRVEAACGDAYTHLAVSRLRHGDFGQFKRTVVAVENKRLHGHDQLLSGVWPVE
ncbi:hypothetical protein D3C81_2295560 [compost metagenome]